MRAVQAGALGVIVWVLVCASPALGCIAQGFAGETPLPAWDTRNALAEQIEADGSALGLPPTQIARLAWALRLGSTAAPALTPADMAVLRALGGDCDPSVDATTDVAADPSFGFDLHLGWRQLVASGAFSALALAALVIAARLHAIGRRRRKRYFCSRPVTCLIPTDAARVCRVEDLSLSGVRLSLRGAVPMRLGAGVVLDFGTFQMDGRVAWANRHFTGIDFDRMLTRAELLHLVRPEKYAAPPNMRTNALGAENGPDAAT